MTTNSSLLGPSISARTSEFEKVLEENECASVIATAGVSSLTDISDWLMNCRVLSRYLMRSNMISLSSSVI